RVRYRWKVHVISGAQVLEALADTPQVWTRLPIQLLRRERLRECHRARVGVMELGNQTNAPGGRCLVERRGHVLRYRGAAAAPSDLLRAEEPVEWSVYHEG